MDDTGKVTFTALVLAGSRGTDPLAEYAGVAAKALIVIDGATMLARVVDALRRAGAARIVASVSDAAVEAHARALGIEVLHAAAGPSASTGEALAALGTPLLVTTADHALLDPDWVNDFIADVPREADIAVLLGERAQIERAAPGTRRTYLRFADGDWSGCNLFWLADARAEAAIGLWRQVEADRKRPWRIVGRLGPGLLLRYLARRLTLADAVTALGHRAGVRAAVVASRHGLAAIDVDKPADMLLVTALLEERKRAEPNTATAPARAAAPPA